MRTEITDPYETWERWFAWRPVMVPIVDKPGWIRVFWEHVERRLIQGYPIFWEYRLPEVRYAPSLCDRSFTEGEVDFYPGQDWSLTGGWRIEPISGRLRAIVRKLPLPIELTVEEWFDYGVKKGWTKLSDH